MDAKNYGKAVEAIEETEAKIADLKAALGFTWCDNHQAEFEALALAWNRLKDAVDNDPS